METIEVTPEEFLVFAETLDENLEIDIGCDDT